MFEDGLARVLPTTMGSSWYQCSTPACGYFSRALGFEREWQRAFPELAQPIRRPDEPKQDHPRRQFEPHLLLDSTWVETGELALATGLSVDEYSFPAVRDIQAQLGAPLSLIGAAHVAARFPFINPLAAVQAGRSAKLAPEKGLAGHLADGGYFDNSGASSIADVWRVMKTTVGNLSFWASRYS